MEIVTKKRRLVWGSGLGESLYRESDGSYALFTVKTSTALDKGAVLELLLALKREFRDN